MVKVPTQPSGVTIAGIEATHLDTRQSPQIGETTTIEVLFEETSELAAPGDRYKALRAYGQYAGEADYGRGLGGRPHVTEHPVADWPVDSHVVSVVYSPDNYADDPFWGLITNIDDNSVTVEGGRSATASTGSAAATDNIYRLTVEIVKLASLSSYDSRGAVLSDLGPTTNQL